jgi:hypothetical protein
MLGEDLTAASAAFHFNRVYKSLIGVPTIRAVYRRREEVLKSAG